MTAQEVAERLRRDYLDNADRFPADREYWLTKAEAMKDFLTILN